ncbi:hypothetical protein SFR_6361 [Streptomyces sp. FR-008]|nr:hypothetical protein SFR_6361 [Streptomyces sp. FR-008]
MNWRPPGPVRRIIAASRTVLPEGADGPCPAPSL